jgi:23S rRNA pseudouridine1911/1915/1917 synthase
MTTLLDHLLKEFPTAKRTTLRRMITERRVTINDRPATRLNQPLAPSDRVRIVGPKRIDAARLIAPLTIVYEDPDLLVVDKPAGLLTSTVAGEKRPTALALERRYAAATQRRAVVGLIHRLDRDASGRLVFSKSNRAYQSLKTQFFKHTVERVYQAEVHGSPSPPRGKIDSWLIERGDGTVRSSKDKIAGAQRAITEYETIAFDKKTKTSTLRVRLYTGRKHQIRVHLSGRGWPIVGDRVYRAVESARVDLSGPLRLRAVQLGLDHPVTGRRMIFARPGDTV